MTRQPGVTSSATSQLIFNSIRLINFVIHRDTTIPLDRTPIVLVTGSNGSGKTLILDALLLAIGFDSKRSQRQRNSAFIGRFDKHAEIVLVLNNFRLDGRRILQSPDKEINRLLDKDKVYIRLRILPSNVLSYWINDRRTAGNRRISRQDIRQLFQVAGVFGHTPLAVTEAETLDRFASQSPRRKFETLLSETGLKDWMEKLEEARLLVIQAQANVTPLQHRIRREEQRLQVLKAAFEAYQKKQQLQETLRNLVIEAAWAEIAYREQLFNQLKSMTTALENDLETERNQLKKLSTRRTELDEKRQDLQAKRATLRETLQSIRDRQMQARGLRQGLERDLEDTSAQISRYRKPKSKATRSSSTKEEVLRSELRDFTVQRDELDDQLTKLSTRISTTEEELASEPHRFPRREEQILRACIQFRKELDKTVSGKFVVGPLFTLIRMKRGQERFETAVKLALGRYAYAFLALNREAFAEAKQLFDKLWSYEKPNLLVARLDSEEIKPRSRPRVKPPVRGWAPDLLQGDSDAVVFLSRVVNTAVAEASADPNLLADAAQQLNGNIITSDGASHYLRFGAFTRPPLPVTVPLGIPLHEVGLTQDPRDILSQLQELRLEEARITRDRVSLNSEISEIRSQLQILQESRTATVSDEDRSLVVSDLQRRADDLQQQIAVLDEELDTYSQEYQKCNSDIAPISTRLLKIDEQIQRLDLRCTRREAEVERLTRDLQEREDELQGIVDQLKSYREAATKHGPRPSKVRSPDEVRDERLRVEAMIDTIPATEQDQKAYKEQEKLVKQLENYLEERRHHLANLMTDVQRRLTEWRRHLEETIETLNHRMNQLLSHFLKQVRLTVRYPDEPSRAELHVQIAINRRGAWRTYDNMSGGERVLSTQTFILALHTLAKSPLHVIDEFTQRLDEASRAAVLSVVQRAVELSRENLQLEPQFLLMAPTTVGLQIPPTMHHIVLVKGQVEN